MFIFSAAESGIQGPVIIHEISGTRIGAISRRAKKTMTLDGGVALTDFGFNEADRTSKIKFKPSFEDYKGLQLMIKLFSSHVMSCEHGLYAGVISELQEGNHGEYTITFLIKEKLI